MFSRSRHVRLLLAMPLMFSLTASSRQTPGTSSSKAKQKSEQHLKASASTGDSAEDAYRNSDFGFTCRVPFGWVHRTKDMQEEGGDPAKSQLLLAVFERPPEVTGDSVNSAIIITAESAASYAGLRSAGDYVLGPLTELTTAKGFAAVQEPYELPVGAKHLVRADFTKHLGKLPMLQSSLVLLEKGYVVSFTFIAGSEDEIEELIEKLSFSPSSSAKPR
jgi:hypothetical protein